MKKESKFKKIWQNKQKRAFIFLIFWFFFFLIIISLSSIKVDHHDDIITYEDMQKELINNDYDYQYIIKINDVLIKCTGSKKDAIDEGIKETNTEVIKYKYDGEKYYKIVLDQEIEYNYLEDINADLINYQTLFNYLNKCKYVLNDNNYKYNDNKYEYQIIIDSNHIKEIKINNDYESYNLTFTNIN